MTHYTVLWTVTMFIQTSTMCNDGLHLKSKKTKFQCTWGNIILNKGRENLAHDHDEYLKKKDVFGFLSINRGSSFLHKILIQVTCLGLIPSKRLKIMTNKHKQSIHLLQLKWLRCSAARMTESAAPQFWDTDGWAPQLHSLSAVQIMQIPRYLKL